jgi:uncharacterized protein YjdB
MKRLVALFGLAMLGPLELQAQAGPGAMISQARQYLDEFRPDSASVLLERALNPWSGANSAQRVRAWVLYGITQLSLNNQTAARAAFREALQRSPDERVDSLEFLEPDNLLRVFNAERSALGPSQAASPEAPSVGYLSLTTRPVSTVYVNGTQHVGPVRGLEVPAGFVKLSFRVEDSTGMWWAHQVAVSINPGRFTTYAISLRRPRSCVGPVDRLGLDPRSLSLPQGSRAQIAVGAQGSGCLPDSVVWTSGNVNVARVDADGWVTATGQGVAVITAGTRAVRGRRTGAQAQAVVNVVPKPR